MDPIIAALTERVVKNSEKRIFSWLGAAGQAALEAIRFNCAKYIQSSFEKCSRVTTLLDRDEASYVQDIYVKTYLKHKDVVIDDHKFLQLLFKGQGLVVQGAGGSGKSMLIKHLLLESVSNSTTSIPLFVELRGLNDIATKDILAFIYYTVTGPSGATMTLEQFKRSLETQFFSLFLDGFDEIDTDQHMNIQKQILKIKNDYPNANIIVSSRPDDRFASWSSFKSYHVQPMEKKEVLDLIEKLRFDEELKKRFHERIGKDLYENNKSFLSNPLLVTIMMITFHQFAEIPHKIHLFYEQAFEALFFRHDASKEAAYSRKKQSKLAINEFRNVLSTFCIFSYTAEKFSFTSSEALDFISQAKKFEDIKFDTASFFSDILKAVCVLQQDGTYYVFTHRSFQEYFSAVFIIRGKTAQIRELLDWVIKNRVNDNVISMAVSMAPALVEREWVLIRLREILKTKYSSALHFIIENGGRPRLFTGDDVTIGVEHINDNLNFILALPQLYPDRFSFKPSDEVERNSDKKLVRNKGVAAPDLIKTDDEFFGSLSIGRWCQSILDGCIKMKEQLEKKHASSEQTISSILKGNRSGPVKKTRRGKKQ